MVDDTDKTQDSALAKVEQLIKALLEHSSSFDNTQNATAEREVNKILALFVGELNIEQGKLDRAGVHSAVRSVYFGKTRLSFRTLSALNWLLHLCESPSLFIPEYKRNRTDYVARKAVDMFVALFEELVMQVPDDVHSGVATSDRPGDSAQR
ncbi:MAG TPA: hypothetical protein VGH44_05080 [Candidatus Saccharimonadia bacterium]|jgi:hypothetical protein